MVEIMKIVIINLKEYIDFILIIEVAINYLKLLDFMIFNFKKISIIDEIINFIIKILMVK